MGGCRYLYKGFCEKLKKLGLYEYRVGFHPMCTHLSLTKHPTLYCFSIGYPMRIDGEEIFKEFNKKFMSKCNHVETVWVTTKGYTFEHLQRAPQRNLKVMILMSLDDRIIS